jgi:hypothetical protein
MPRSRKHAEKRTTVLSDAPWISRRPADEKRIIQNLQPSGGTQGDENAAAVEPPAPVRNTGDLDCVQRSISMLTLTQCTTRTTLESFV